MKAEGGRRKAEGGRMNAVFDHPAVLLPPVRLGQPPRRG